MTGLPRTKRRTRARGDQGCVHAPSLVILTAPSTSARLTKTGFGDAESGSRRGPRIASRAGSRTGKYPDLALDDPTKHSSRPDFYETARTGIHYLLPVIVLSGADGRGDVARPPLAVNGRRA